MNTFALVIISAFVFLLTSLAGNAVTRLIGRHQTLLLATASFGAGFVVYVGFAPLFEHGLGVYALFGAFILFMGVALMESRAHHHSAHGTRAFFAFTLADAVHGIADGLLVGLAYKLGPLAGVQAMLGTTLHEVIQEGAERPLLTQTTKVSPAWITLGTLLGGSLSAVTMIASYLTPGAETGESSHELFELGVGITLVVIASTALTPRLWHRVLECRPAIRPVMVGVFAVGLIVHPLVQGMLHLAGIEMGH